MGKNGQNLMEQVHFANSYSSNMSVLKLAAEFE